MPMDSSMMAQDLMQRSSRDSRLSGHGVPGSGLRDMHHCTVAIKARAAGSSSLIEAIPRQDIAVRALDDGGRRSSIVRDMHGMIAALRALAEVLVDPRRSCAERWEASALPADAEHGAGDVAGGGVRPTHRL